jgi:hypothetical protein
MIHRFRPLIEFHIPRFSNNESSRQFIVRSTLGKSGGRFVQKGINPHLLINRLLNQPWRNGSGYFIDWSIKSPGLPLEGDLGDVGTIKERGEDFGLAPSVKLGIESSLVILSADGSDDSVESGAGGGSFLSPPNCRITG